MGIYLLDDVGRPVFLASTVGEHDRIDDSVSELRHYHAEEMNVIMPILNSGRSSDRCASTSITKANLQEGRMTLAIGAIISLFLTVVVGSLNNRSYHLQREVQQRTEDRERAWINSPGPWKVRSGRWPRRWTFAILTRLATSAA